VTASLLRVARVRPIAAGHLAALAFFLATTAAVLLTRNPVVIAIWLGIWLFAAVFSRGRAADGGLMLLVGVIFFYPEFSSAFSSLTEKVVVLTMLLGAFAFWFAPQALRAAAHCSPLAVVAVYWTCWGLASYAAVAFNYLMLHQVRTPVPDGWRTLYTETSAIKAALPVLVGPLALAVPLVALRSAIDWRRMMTALIAATAIVLVISAVEYVAGVHVVPYDPSRLLHGTSRMTGFSVPDANGFARLLLMPVLMTAAAIVAAPRTVGPAAWAVLAAALIAIVMTQSRTAYLSTAAGLGVLFVLTLRRRRTVLVATAAVAAVVFAAIVLDVRAAFASGSERLSTSSLFLRMELWQGVVAILRENPWFGAHPGGYTISLLQMGYPPWRIHSPHNLYLYLGAEWGVPMMLFCIALQALTAIYAFRVLRRPSAEPMLRAAALGALALTVTYAVHGITETVPPVFLFLTAGIAASAERITREAA
jgi:O-antigen ligase